MLGERTAAGSAVNTGDVTGESSVGAGVDEDDAIGVVKGWQPLMVRCSSRNLLNSVDFDKKGKLLPVDSSTSLLPG